MSLPVAILCGGQGSRLGALTASTPKALVQVAGQPFISHQFALLRRAGFHDVVLLVGHLGTEIVESVGDGTKYGVNVRYVSDGPIPLGTGGAVRKAIPFLGDAFMVIYGDSYLDCNYADVARRFVERGRLGMMTVVRNDGKLGRSNVRIVDGEVVSYSKAGGQDMQHLDYGLNLFRSAAFEGETHESFDLAAVHDRLIRMRELDAFEMSERFFEIGSISGLEEAAARIQSASSRLR